MDRTEFCQLMAEAKKKSGVRTTDLCFQLRMLPPILRRLENGVHNFGVDKAIEYLNALGYVIVISQNEAIQICEYGQFIAWLKDARKGIYTQQGLAEAIQVTQKTIANIETQKAKTSIDVFLKIADTLGYKVEIKEK